jgi:hypothetical protein
MSAKRSRKVEDALKFQRRVLPAQEKAIAALNEVAEEVDKIVSWICDTAIGFGMNAKNNNVHNAQLFISATLKTAKDWEATAQELGYTSVPIALKALGQFKQPEIISDVSHLPEVFRKPAVIWLTGKPKNGPDKGFAPLRARDAELEHIRLLPWLLKAWQMLETNDEGEEIRAELELLYVRSTPDEFTNKCYIIINDMEEPSLEEEFEQQITKASSVFERAQSLRAISERDYGVGGALEEVSWDDD